jgi:hypothetical protein
VISEDVFFLFKAMEMGKILQTFLQPQHTGIDLQLENSVPDIALSVEVRKIQIRGKV